MVIASGFYPAGQRFLEATVRRSARSRRLADAAFFRALLAPGILAFDVGANVGQKTEAMLDSGLRVVAFEPQSDAAAELLARCEGRSHFRFVQAAMGDVPCIAPMHVSIHHTMSSLVPEWVVGHDAHRTIHVPVVTFDDAVRAFGMPAFCKIDVEGSELQVLEGMTRLPDLISFEYHRADPERAKVFACIDRLAELGHVEFNLSRAEVLELVLPEWMRPADFRRWFAERLPSSPEFGYGDVFVRRTVDPDAS